MSNPTIAELVKDLEPAAEEGFAALVRLITGAADQQDAIMTARTALADAADAATDEALRKL